MPTREKWIAAIRREGWTPTASSRVCGRHFVSGRKSDDPILHVDYVPNLHMGYVTSRTVKSDDRYHRQKVRSERIEEQGKQTLAANILLELSQTEPEPPPDIVDTPVSNIHDGCLKEMVKLRLQNQQLLQELQRLQKERGELRAENDRVRFGANTLKDNDHLTSVYTGIPSYAAFMWILTFVLSILPTKQNLNPGDIFYYNYSDENPP
ncbi:uncharacterized protein [Argopecten irradians]|uniref:uncharacterized protein n=1 Tax=Argopecten irradians TaxID=31199 RepID=UPI003713E00C